MTEEWRSVYDWPQYEASSLGRVRHAVTKHVRKPWWNRLYRGWQLNIGGRVRYRTYFVHQIVALAFFGPCPLGKEVNHKDGDRHNNRPDNLEYLTRQENIDHSVRNGLHPRGTRVHTSKLTEDQVREIRAAYRRGIRGAGQRTLADRYGVDPQCIWAIVNGVNWAWLTD